MEKNVKQFFRNLLKFKQATISSESSNDSSLLTGEYMADLLDIVTPLIARVEPACNRLYDG
jgi:hypothetical protein